MSDEDKIVGIDNDEPEFIEDDEDELEGDYLDEFDDGEDDYVDEDDDEDFDDEIEDDEPPSVTKYDPLDEGKPGTGGFMTRD